MAILKRINKYQGLKDIDILVEEQGVTSQYFQVYDFPEQIPQGKSSFLVAGSPFLKDNVELKVEILDAGGNTVYTEAVPNYLEGAARRVSVEVYDDVVPGDGFMYIVGELKKNYKSISALTSNQDEITDTIIDPDTIANIGGEDVPLDFQGTYNVRYVRPVFINASLPNSQPIFFYQQPRVSVTEVVKPFIEQLAPSGSVVLSGSIEANPAPDIPVLPPTPDAPPGFPKNPTAEGLGKIGQINEIFKSSKKSKSNPFRNSGFRSRGRLVRRASPEIDDFTMKMDKLEKSSENPKDKASSALVGASLEIKNPKIDLVKFPADEFDAPSSFKTSIKKVLNEETIVPVDTFYVTKKSTGEKVAAPIIPQPEDGSGQSEVTMSYQPFPEQSLSATHNRSFADITVANLRTFSGDVYKAKIYGKSQGSLGDFELLHEGTIESPQTLIDPFSVDGFLNIGYFHTQSIVDNYWLLSGGTATRDDSKLLDGIQISGSNYGVGDSVEFTTSGSFALEKGVPYSITFNAHYFKEDKVQDNGDVAKDFELDVQVEQATLIGGSLSDTYQSVGKVDLDNLTELEGSIPGIYTTFVTPSDVGPTLKLKFKLNAGRAVINDVVVRPHAETNFNPDYFRVVIPMAYPLPKKPDLYDFLVEFYDVNNNIAETFSISQNVEFTGAPLNIDGEDNLLSGSMYIGSAQGEGMELAGVSSAFLRSIGYQGFQNTIDNNKGGFLIFSGSIGGRLTASEAYDGVGLEIVDAHGAMDRYLKFRTNPSTFEVVTDQFFLGQSSLSYISGSNGNIKIFSSGNTTLSGSEVDILTPNFFLGGSTAFVSGSGGNIEISSSNFHLTPEGSVTMSGDITANAGYIGDWKIVDGQISGSNITLNADNSTIFKTDQGPGSDTGESFAQLKDEYYIDFTPTEESPDNYYIKMGPNFGVDKDGILHASGAKFEGSITASQGLIGGFTTDSSSFHSNNIFISGSPDAGGVDNPRHMFISTSNFNVKQNGDITGSQVLFTAGNIGKWVIENHLIKSAGVGGIRLNGNEGGAEISINKHTFGNGPGIQLHYNSGVPQFFVGSGSNDYMKYTGAGGIDIKSAKFELDTTNLELSSTNASMSLGEGKIDLVGGSTSYIQVGSANSITLKDDGTDRFLAIGNKTSFSHFDQSTAGVLFGTDGGTTKFEIVGNGSNYISFNNTAFDIKAEEFGLKTSTQHISSSNGGVIAMGATIPQKLEDAGLFLSGSGQFSFYSSSRGHIVYDGTDFKIASKNLTIDTSTLDINTAGGGNIALGTGSPSLSAAGIFLSGSGDFNFQRDSNNFIRHSGGAFSIKSSTFDLDATTLIMDSAGDSGNGIIRLGASGGPSSPTNDSAGIYMDGGGALNVVGNATNYFRVDGGSFTIKSDTFDLQTTTFSASSADTGKIALGQTPPTRYDSGNGIFFDGDANFLIGSASGDRIQYNATNNAFAVQVGSLEVAASNIQISSNQASMSIGETTSGGKAIVLDGASTSGQILVGSETNKQIEIFGNHAKGYIRTGKTSVGDTTEGFWFANNNANPEFHIGDATNYVKLASANLEVATNQLEVSASTIQLSTANVSMSLGHTNNDPYGTLIMKGGSTPTFAMGRGAVSMSLDSGSGIFFDGDGNFRMGDDDGSISMENGNFMITGSDVDINVTDLNISSTGFKLSSTQASMSLGTGQEIFMKGGNNSPYIAIQPAVALASKNYGEAGFFVGVQSGTTPKFSLVGTGGHVKFDGSGIDIDTQTFEMDANNIELSSAHASMSLGEGNIKLQGADSRIYVGVSGSGKELKLQGGSTDSYLAIGSKEPGFSAEGSGTSGILIGMDSTNPQAEFVKSTTDYFIFDDGVDIKSVKFELDANDGDLQISAAHKSMSLGGQVKLDGTNTKIEVGSSNKITLQGGSTDNYIVMGSKTSFSHEGSGTAGILIGMDGSNPQAEFVKGANDYFIFDNGVDIKTTQLELDAGSLQLSNTHNSMSLSPDGSNPLRLVGDGTDAFITMGSKTSFGHEGSGTAGIIIGMDAANPQAEFVKNSSNYLIFDDGIDIKTDTFKLDTARLDIDSSTSRVQVFDGDGDEVVRLGELTGTGLYGLKIYDGSGTATSNELLKLGGHGNEIAGWSITNDRLTGGAMIIRKDGTIESSGFASNVPGSGFRLTAANGGFLEVENARIRGTMSTTVFEKESVNAVGGQLYVANSTAIKSGSIVTAAAATMSVDNVTGFTGSYNNDGEIISAKKVSNSGFSTEYMLIQSASRDAPDSDTDFSGKLYVVRGYSGSAPSANTGSLGDPASPAQFYSGSQVLVSTGRINTGYIRLNANPNDETTPYIDIVERTGSAIYDTELKARLGDLSGISSGLLHGSTNPGFGLFTENIFLQGAITATTGSFTGVVHIGTSTQEMKLGTNVNSSNDGIYINSNNYWYTDGAWKVGGANYSISNDSSGNISIVPQSLDIRVGSVDFELSSTQQSMSFADKDILIKKDGSDASITVGGTTSKQITIKGSNTQGYIASGKSNAGDTTAGFWIANNNTDTEFHIGDATNFLKYDGGSLTQQLQSFELDVNEGDLQISSQHKSASYGDKAIVIDGSKALISVGTTANKQIFISGSTSQGLIYSGKTSAASTTEGFWLANNNQDIEFVVGDATDYIKFDDNALSLSTRTFELNAGDGDLQISSGHTSMSLADDMILLKAAGNAGSIQVGQHSSNNIMITGSTTAGVIKSGKSSVNDLTSGFYIANDAGTEQFHLGDSSNALKYDGSNLHITASQVNLSGTGVTIDVNTFAVDADDFQIASTVPSMSLGYDTNSNAGIEFKGGSPSTIKFGPKGSPKLTLQADTADAFLQIGSPTFANPAQSGILIGSDAGTAEFYIYNSANKQISYDGSDFNLRTTKLYLETTGLKLSGDSGTGTSNYLALGSATSATAGAGIWLDGGGNARFGTATDGDNFIYFNGTALQIKADDIDISSTAFNLNANSGDLIISSSDHRISLANENIILDGTSTGFMQIGGVSSVTDTGGSNKGFYAEGDGDFIAKAAANEYIKFDSGKLGIKASDLSILTTGTNKIKMESSASTPTIALGTTLPTAYNSGNGFYVDGTGKFLAGNASGNHMKFDGSTLTVAGTINILGGDLAGIDSDTISGSYPPASASQDLGFATQVVLDSDGMDLKNAAGNVTLASYGSTITIGRTDHAHSTFTSTTITQKDGDDKKVLVAASGVIGLYGNDEEKAVFSSTGSLFRGDAQNTFTRVDSNGLTIVDNGSVQGTFTNGTINLYGNNGTDRKVTIDSNGMRAYYDANNFTNVKSDGVAIHAGNSSTAAAEFGTTVTIRGNNSDADRVVINSGGVDLFSNSVQRAGFHDTGSIFYGDAANTYTRVNSSGMSVVLDGSTAATFGSDVTLNGGTITLNGASTADRLVVTNAGVDLFSNNIQRAGFHDTGSVFYGDAMNTYTRVNSSGMSVVLDGSTAATFGSDITLNGGTIQLNGASTNDRLVVTNAGVDLFSNNVQRAGFHDTGSIFYGDAMDTYTRVNSSGVSIVLDGSTAATFGSDVTLNGGTIQLNGASTNDRLVVTNAGVDLFTNNVQRAGFHDTGSVFYGDAMDTYTRVYSSGMSVVLDGSEKAAIGSDITLNGGTITLNGASTNDRVVINNDGMAIYTANVLKASAYDAGFTAYGDDVNTKAVMSSAGMTIFNDDTIADPGTGVAHFGSTLRIGAIADDTSRLEIDSSGNLTIKNRQSTTDTTTVQLTAAGALSLTGQVTATSGYIGNGSDGFNIQNTFMYNGKPSLTSLDAGVYLGTDGIAVGTRDAGDSSLIGNTRVDASGSFKMHGDNASYNVQFLTNYQENNPGIIMQRPAIGGFVSGIPYTLRISSTGSYYNPNTDYTTNVDFSQIFNISSGQDSIHSNDLSSSPVGKTTELCNTGYIASATGRLFHINNTAIGACEVSFTNQNIEFEKVGGAGGSTVRVNLKTEVYQNTADTTVGAEKVFERESGVITYSWNTNYTMTSLKCVVSEQYFFLRHTILSYEEIGGAVSDPSWEMGGATGGTNSSQNNTLVGYGYVTKTMIMGTGFQTYSGPYSEAKFGKINRVIGDLTILEDKNNTRGQLVVEGGVNIGTETREQTNYMLYVDGDMGASGNVVAYVTSDERLKEDIVPIGNGLDLIQKMNPVNFRWNDDGIQFGWGRANYQDNMGYDIGFLAQELQPILPEVIGKVKHEEEEYLGVHYEKIVPVLVKAVQEQQEQIDDLKVLVKKLTEDK